MSDVVTSSLRHPVTSASAVCMRDFDLIFIGGGMVGACAAALAAANEDLSGLRIALLDGQPPTRAPEGELDLRVSAVSRASQHILESLGAWKEIGVEHVSAYTDMVVWDAQSRPRGVGSIRFAASECGEPDLGHIVENRRLQWAIYESRPFRDRVTVLQAPLAALDLESDPAVVTLADGRRLAASLVVGADGAASASRKFAAIEATGWDYGQHAFVTHVTTEHLHAHTAWQRFLPAGPFAFLPLADGRSSVVWTTQPEHAQRLLDASLDWVGQELTVGSDKVLGSVAVAGPRAAFPLRLAHARHYCKERFVLIGDAAHAVHPLAGQGVNLGFLDAAALVETLGAERAATNDDRSYCELRVLRRYERWRKSENGIAMGLIDGLNRLFGASSDTVGWVRRTGLTAVDRSLFVKRALMGRAMGTRGEVPRIARQLR